MTNQSDNVNLLFRFLFNKKSSGNNNRTWNGQRRKITLLLAPLLGSYLIFASMDECSSALEQIDIKTMRDSYH